MNNSALSELGRRIQPPPISWLMQLALSHPKLISLAAGFTDNESLPVGEVRASLDEILRSRKAGRTALQYGSTQGDPVLRQLTSEHLQKLDRGGAGEPFHELSRGAAVPVASSGGVSPLRKTPGGTPGKLAGEDACATVQEPDARPPVSEQHLSDRMIITNGSQQLLYMATEALCDSGDIVLVEDPTYFVYLGILQSRGIRARGVRMEKDGLDLTHLESLLESLKKSGGLKRVKSLYLVSYFQNPTGITTSFEKKAGALELLRKYERAAGHPIYLLEDAAYRELRFKGADAKSALAVKGASDRVLYAGTYSKPFATGARVGFGVLPEPVFTAALRIKGSHDFGTSNLLQQMMARTLASGRYQKHLVELKKRYARKAQTMLVALKKHFPAPVEWAEPEGGLYFWARLPCGMKSGVKSRVFQTALKHDVLYVPGELCYADDETRAEPDNEMRLSFGGASEKNIRAGVVRLGGVLHDFLGR